VTSTRKCLWFFIMKNNLREAIAEDKLYYWGIGKKRVLRIISHNPLYQRGKYIVVARKAGYYTINNRTLLNKILQFYYVRKKNVLGEKLGIELGPNVFGRRIRIYHNNIIVNAGAQIGDDCEFYGDNCIGNKGSSSAPLDSPILGNGVSFGVGAKAIGKVSIADGVTVSSMSLVNKDLLEGNSLYGGIPAVLLKSD